jgi:hypothetical protein
MHAQLDHAAPELGFVAHVDIMLANEFEPAVRQRLLCCVKLCTFAQPTVHNQHGCGAAWFQPKGSFLRAELASKSTRLFNNQDGDARDAAFHAFVMIEAAVAATQRRFSVFMQRRCASGLRLIHWWR